VAVFFAKRSAACSGSGHGFGSYIVHHLSPNSQSSGFSFVKRSAACSGSGHRFGSYIVHHLSPNSQSSGFSFAKRSAACSGSGHGFESYIVHQKGNHTEGCGFSFWYGIRDRTRTNPMQGSGGALRPPVQKLVATLIIIASKGMIMQIESYIVHHLSPNSQSSGFSFVKRSAACSGSGHRFESYIVHQKRNHTEGCGFSFWYGISRARTNPMQVSGGALRPPVQKLVATLIIIPSKGMIMQIESYIVLSKGQHNFQPSYRRLHHRHSLRSHVASLRTMTDNGEVYLVLLIRN